MTRVPVTVGLMPSMLDRLIDPESAGTENRRGYGIEKMVQVVRRDLEDLLNTRASALGSVAEYPELMNSVYTFGMPDLTSKTMYNAMQRKALGSIVEETVEKYEPRLKEVHALLVDEDAGEARHIKFYLFARLRVEPSPEVGFETVLELTTGHASVGAK